ncbi:glycoside hydrolase superfamily [Kalaharituber pfeilii]|nr:glycoside hydrolase superfamily [Kalaharituber pfeilii]
MRAKYQPIPPPPPVIAPVAAGWDGSGDLEKGSGSADIADKTALLDKRASTSSGIGNTKRKRRCHPCFWLLLLVGIILLIILIPVGVLVVGKDKSGNKNSGSADNESEDRRDGLKNIDRASIPPEARGTYYDPFDWYDTKDFNCTYTDEKVGDLPIMGLFSEWDDSVRANDNVPPLNEPFDYGKQPIRGVNVGGWFVMEPFITPSYFKEWDSRFGVVDEYTLSKQLGPETARKTFEKHYSEFIKEEDFRMIRDAGLDHVRIPFGYWAVMQLDGDPYVYQVEWRYLLRAIEYCRKYGLRVKLDLHSVPGGANGWNHSGRLGPIHWLNGTDGDRNAQLTLELHDKMSKFFSQPRYKNVVTMYGLVNEPRMTFLDADKVIAWSEQAYKIIRGNGYEGKIVFGDGFRGLEKWKGEFQSLEGMVLDVHQYVIFNTGQISQTHTGKVQFACKGWSAQLLKINNPDTGYGPTMVGEWGQADTDCTPYLNNVGVGSRWEGTLNYGEDEPGNVLTPTCPNKNQCSCEKANEHPNNYSDDYKLFLKTFAIAQMDAFENGWGWMYWTWQTEDSHQWSYRKGLEAGILPKAAVNREWSCQDDIPDFAARGLPEYY